MGTRIAALGLVILLAIYPMAVAFAQPRIQQEGMMPEEFPGYEPKTTPDTITDYRPAIGDRLAELPPADLNGLPDLIRALQQQNELAVKNPGRWIKGQPGLGGDPDEYEPSDEELFASEIGKRIRMILIIAAKDKVDGILAQAGLQLDSLEFNEFEYRHVDVMGSGRFFYASPPKPVIIPLH